jgi:ABC-type dipeptide/oligopeptide/nickel transport system permease component
MKILIKLFLVIVSFFVVAGFSFLIMRYQSNRPLQSITTNNIFSQHTVSVYSPDYLQLYNHYGLNQAPFYFSISNCALPDSFKYLPSTTEKDFLIKWTCKLGAPNDCYAIYQGLISFHNESWEIPPARILDLQHTISCMQNANQIDSVNFYFQSLKNKIPQNTKTFLCFNKVDAMKVQSRFLQYIPTFHFNLNNQFSNWMQDVFGSGGGVYANSWYSKESVWLNIKKPMIITALISIFSFCFIVFSSVFISCELFLSRGSKFSKIIYSSLSFLYSVPAFFIGAILIYCFSNPMQFSILPSNFSFSPLFMSDEYWFLSILNSWSYFILPVFTLSFGAIIFFIILLYQSIETEFTKNYVLSAKMMGYDQRKIVYQLVLKNAVYSIATFIFLLIPALLSGSIIVEQLFSIPGVGSLLMSAARNQDVPIIIILFGFTGVVTSICFFALDYFQTKINGREIYQTVIEE